MIPQLDLLARLRDVHPPAEPPWWPLAPGWWIALALLVALAVLVIRYAPPWWRRLRLRRRLLAALDAIARRHRAGAPADAAVVEVSQLLRLAALTRFPERNVAGLHGGDWVAFLESRDRKPDRMESVREALTAAPYRPLARVDAAPLLKAARGWLRAVI